MYPRIGSDASSLYSAAADVAVGALSRIGHVSDAALPHRREVTMAASYPKISRWASYGSSVTVSLANSRSLGNLSASRLSPVHMPMGCTSRFS
jgi:hypothetical protein